MAHSANREAVGWFEQALSALQHLPDSRETLEQAIDLRLDLRQALSPLGETRRIIDYLRAAEIIAETLGDQRRLGRISSHMIGCYWWLREYDRAIEAGQRALALAEAHGDFVSQVVANYQLGLRYRERGDHRRAIEALKWVVTSLGGDLLRERFGGGDYPAVGARGGLTWCLAELGDFAEGSIYGKEAVQISEALDHPFSLGVACFDLGGLHLLRGHLGEAISVLERGLALCQRWDLPGLFPTVASRLGAAYTLAGRFHDGLPLLERVEELATTTGRVGEGSLQTVWLGDAYRLVGRLAEAIRLGERAVDISASEGKPGVRAWALRLLGDTAAHREPPER